MKQVEDCERKVHNQIWLMSQIMAHTQSRNPPPISYRFKVAVQKCRFFNQKILDAHWRLFDYVYSAAHCGHVTVTPSHVFRASSFWGHVDYTMVVTQTWRNNNFPKWREQPINGFSPSSQVDGKEVCGWPHTVPVGCWIMLGQNTQKQVIYRPLWWTFKHYFKKSLFSIWMMGKAGCEDAYWHDQLFTDVTCASCNIVCTIHLC